MKRSLLLVMTAAVLIAFITYSAAYSYKYMTGKANIAAPVVWFEDPGTPNVMVQLYREGTAANITVTLTRDIVLERRYALFYHHFRDDPFSTGKLLELQCDWVFCPHKVVRLKGVNVNGDNTWDKWCITIVNPSILNVSEYVTNGSIIYVSFTTGYTADKGKENRAWLNFRVAAIYLNDTATPTFYAIGFRDISEDAGGIGKPDKIYTNISYWRNPTYYSIKEEFIDLGLLEVSYMYHVSAAIDFSSWTIYHYINDTLLITAYVPDTYRQRPYAVGMGYRYEREKNAEQINFGSIVVTIERPPWYINITGLPDGWRAVLKNATGYVVSSATAIGGVAVLHAVPQRPIYIGSPHTTWEYRPDYLVFRNATIEIYDENNNLVFSKMFPEVVGGDLYTFTGFDGILLSVYSNLTVGFYGMLANASAQLVPGVNGEIGLFLPNYTGTTQNISIVNGVITSTETNTLYTTPPAQWTNKWLAFNVVARFRTKTIGIIYNIKVNFVWWVNDRTQVIYPINITVIAP